MTAATDGLAHAAAGRRALVTGASSGIGAAIVRRLHRDGWSVVAAARRAGRLATLAAELGDGVEPYPMDVTSSAEVAALAEHLARTGPLHAVVNNAGGALGLDRVEDADVERWRRMYAVNVLGTLDVTRSTLPLLRSSGGDVVVVTSTAAHGTYEGGGGYVAAKHAERVLAETLRLELVGEPVRVVQVAPGSVGGTEFHRTRFGDDARAAAALAGFEALTPTDVADAVTWALSRRAAVCTDLIVLRPRAQANNTTTARTPDPRPDREARG